MENTNMLITYKLYREIIEKLPDAPPEIGGILGGYNDVVRYTVLDTGILEQNYCKCRYIPDVEYLNQCIELWSKKQIDFYGMFHTHFYGISTLSDGDKEYMKAIMHAMPDSKNKLYFPIAVLPERILKVYVCIRDKDEIKIIEDEMEFV